MAETRNEEANIQTHLECKRHVREYLQFHVRSLRQKERALLVDLATAAKLGIPVGIASSSGRKGVGSEARVGLGGRLMRRDVWRLGYEGR